MNEPPQDEPAGQGGSPTPLQRVLMDRAREQAARAQARPPRRPFQTVMAIVLALAAVLIIGGAINAFLASMQIAMHTMDEQEKKQEAAREAEKRKAPMPAYVVPGDEEKKQ